MKVTFKNEQGLELSAKLELPKSNQAQAYAIFAHCFTCSKNLTAVRNIARSLTNRGFGVLRFDFTGLGDSEGSFAKTNFSTNINDIFAAADFLNSEYSAPKLLIGHSLGGAAVLFAGKEIESVEAIATIGAPFGPGHIKHMFENQIDQIESEGSATVQIGGRPFEVQKQFLEDIEKADTKAVLKELRKAILILHSPQDRIVHVDNASKIYSQAHHPKSFISLDGADHLLTDKNDSSYAGVVIGAWASRYISSLPDPNSHIANKEIPVSVIINGNSYTSDIYTSSHHIIADEPEQLGGNDLGPNPFELLLSSLGSCTAMTLRMYINRKKWNVDEINVQLDSAKEDNMYVIFRSLIFKGDLDNDQINRLHEIADKCPVHKVLSNKIEVRNK